MPKPSDDDWEERKVRIIGLGERSFHKSYYPQLRENLDRLERFRTLLDRTADFVLLLTLPEGIVVDANAAFAELLEASVESVIGRPLASLGVCDADAVLTELRDEMPLAARSGEAPAHALLSRFGRQGNTIWFELSYRATRLEQCCYGVLVGRDITLRKEAEERAAFLAHHDALTGLPNVVLLQDRMQQAIAQRGAKLSALLCVDLDHFKTINDSLGRHAGDQLLTEVAHRLAACTTGADSLSRQSGDEFLILLPNVPDVESVIAFLGKVTEVLSQPFRMNGEELTLNASIGIAMHPNDGSDFETLAKHAEIAMYRAKEAGRNTYRFFDAATNVEAGDRLAIHLGLARGLDRGEFSVHYQPQVDIASGTLVGAEALLRWNHPVLGPVSPARFIPVAEESGLIVPLGEWVLRQACRDAVQWHRSGLPNAVVAVNLSAIQIRRGDIDRCVARAIEESGIAPEQLELEFTESVLIRETQEVLATVAKLKDLGVKLSIDDFGTGYSSLSYLKCFTADKLKIDQSFIHDLHTSVADAAIVRAIVQLAHGLGLRTIAEGVEDERTLDCLRNCECDEAQGYLIERPIPNERFLANYTH